MVFKRIDTKTNVSKLYSIYIGVFNLLCAYLHVHLQVLIQHFFLAGFKNVFGFNLSPLDSEQRTGTFLYGHALTLNNVSSKDSHS